MSWQLQLHFRYSPDEDTYVIQLLFPRNLKLEFAVVQTTSSQGRTFLAGHESLNFNNAE